MGCLELCRADGILEVFYPDGSCGLHEVNETQSIHQIINSIAQNIEHPQPSEVSYSQVPLDC